MIGLRAYARDPELCARLGDEDLALPAPPEVLAAVATSLASDGAPAPRAAALEYSRWKPAVSSLGVWRVTFEDGSERVISGKRYRDLEKLHVLTGRRFDDEHLATTLGPFHPLAIDLGQHLAWWVFPADRALRGLARAVHAHRAARLVQSALELGELALKKRKARADLLRYKPERRAVLRLEAPRRGAPGSVVVALRVHPPERAATIAARRAACAVAPEVGPRLLAHDAPAGTLVEEWLEGRPPADASESKDHAEDAGALLARLHAAPLPAEERAAYVNGGVDLGPWLERVEGLAHAAGELARPLPPTRTTWIHGDVHGGQLLLGPRGARLVDLDDLAPGDPLADLADFVADHLVGCPDADLATVAAPLLAGYVGGGGPRVDLDQLRARTAHALVRSAAGALRRLEEDAPERARALVALAREVAPR